MEAKDLKLEVSSKFIDGEENNFQVGNVKFVVTPPLDEDYWQFRVKVDDDQAIVGFPKFHTIGIGFAKEDDWNTNLPHSYKAETIFEHIKKNKRYASIPDELCIKAIKMIQKVAKEMEKAEREAENIIARKVVPALFEEDGKELSKKEFAERCHVQRANKRARYADSGALAPVRKFCLYFDMGGRDHFGYTFKAKMYARTQTEALQRFHSMIRRYALGESEPANDWNNEEFYVSLPEENKITGFKIALSF